METEQVSILIPVFNRVSLVSETIDSALNQTYKNIEIIIVDNCSNDGTWELLKQYALKDHRIRIFRNNENIGPVRNWKHCIDEARGQYAKILFSDDLIDSNFIEETIRHFNENVAFVLSKIQVFGVNKSFTLGNFTSLEEIRTSDYFNNILLFDRYRFPVSPGAALFRTHDLKKSLEIDLPNPFELDFKKFGAGNDLLLFLNTASNYNIIKISNKTTSFFRSHNDSFTIGNRLNPYYEYSKLYFIRKSQPQLLSKFKSVLWLRYKRKQTDNRIFNLIEGKIKWFYLLMQISKRISVVSTKN